MARASHVQQRLEQAGNLPEILGAAYDAFAEMLSVIRGYQDSGSPFYAALVMAAAVGADGRDALSWSPSLPLPSGCGEPPELPFSIADPVEVAAYLAALSEAVGSRLRVAATTADRVADRQACEDGARYADEIHALATGNGP